MTFYGLALFIFMSWLLAPPITTSGDRPLSFVKILRFIPDLDLSVVCSASLFWEEVLL